MNREDALKEIENSIEEGRVANLTGANLQRAYLAGANLREARLGGADLEGADLRGAYLEEAYIQGAYLQGADLRGAYLDAADLEEACLEGAHLEGADLRGAHLEEAYLEGAHLEGANLAGAHLEGANLREAYLHRVDLGGAYLEGAIIKRGLKIKSLRVFSGLYPYTIFAYVDINNVPGVRMGCLWKTVVEWDAIGIENSNVEEFPNDGSKASEERKVAFNYARAIALLMLGGKE